MDTDPTMLASTAHVSTTVPQRYLTQLCKHFQHKLPVAQSEGRGRIEFPGGCCELDATTEAGTLTLSIVAGDEAGLTRLENVVARHLERFAFREKPAIRWTRVA